MQAGPRYAVLPLHAEPGRQNILPVLCTLLWPQAVFLEVSGLACFL